MKKKVYLVGVREVHVSTMRISATTEEAAISKILEGEGEELMLEYSDTLDSENWTIEVEVLEES